MPNAIELIAAERQRQIDVEGWTPEHDDEHDGGELSRAAACYAIATRHLLTAPLAECTSPPRLWPWDAHYWKPSGPENRGQIRNLVKAGALLVAEIERLQRAGREGDSRE